MAVVQQATWKANVSSQAIVLSDGVRSVALLQVNVAGRSEAEIQAALDASVSVGGVVLPDLYVHLNRDGSVALASGAEPVIWPEDE